MGADGNNEIRMEKYIEESIEAFGKELRNARAPTPAKKTLFDINTNSKRLGKVKAETFHHTVVKLLYVSKRYQLDIQLPISMPCNRVSCNIEEDWSNIKKDFSLSTTYDQGTSDHRCR